MSPNRQARLQIWYKVTMSQVRLRVAHRALSKAHARLFTWTLAEQVWERAVWWSEPRGQPAGEVQTPLDVSFQGCELPVDS